MESVGANLPPAMPERRSSAWSWGIGLLLAAILAGVLLVLFAFDPSHHKFYPRCMLYSMTGLQCPGCGGLRAAHALLHGEVAQAFRFNPLLVVLSPVLVYLAVREAARKWFRKTLPPVFRRPAVLWGLLAVLIIFSILRNLPQAAHWFSF